MDVVDAVCGGGVVAFMGDEDEGELFFFPQLEEEVEDGAGVFFIEVAGGFIAEEEVRGVHESASDGDALAFAAGKLAGLVAEAFGKADAGEQRSSAFPEFDAPAQVFRPRAQHGWEQDVFKCGQFIDEMVSLEDEAEIAVSDGGALAFLQSSEVPPAAGDFAEVGHVDKAEDMEERALAGAAGAGHGDEFAFCGVH